MPLPRSWSGTDGRDHMRIASVSLAFAAVDGRWQPRLGQSGPASQPGFEDRFAESLLCFLESQRNSWELGEFNTMPPQSPRRRHCCSSLQRKSGGNREAEARFGDPAARNLGRIPGVSFGQERGKIAYYSKRLEKNIEHVSINAKANPNACLSGSAI